MSTETPTGICLPKGFSRGELDELYLAYNRREFVHPDPLEFVYNYNDIADREIAGLIASSLAYGRVAQILRNVGIVLSRIGPSPFRFVTGQSLASMRQIFSGLKHRFTTGDDVAALLWSAGRLILNHGSLEACFMEGIEGSAPTILPALSEFVDKLVRGMPCAESMFMPRPKKGSACKRLNLFLRWMVRMDDVDPGGWSGIDSSKLIIPLDTHMHKLSLAMGLTCRKQADMRTALEITDAFRSIDPTDPVRYDFCLTRLGIRDGIDLSRF